MGGFFATAITLISVAVVAANLEPRKDVHIITFPGASQGFKSLDGVYALVNHDSDTVDASGNNHQLSLKTIATGKIVQVLSYPRHIEVMWSLDSIHFSVTNYEDSDYGTCLVYDLRKLASPLDLGAMMEKQIPGFGQMVGDSHINIRCSGWDSDKAEIFVQVTGYNDLKRTEISKQYSYGLNTGKFTDWGKAKAPEY